MNTAIILSVVCAFILILLSISIYFNVKHGIIILKMQDTIERSLDALDSNYKRISEILETPVFFDSVEVRQVLSEIKSARNSILYVANQLTDTQSAHVVEEDKDD